MVSVVRRFLPVVIVFFALLSFAHGEPQDPPDIAGYELPKEQRPAPRGYYMDFVDMGILFLALSLATYFILRKRSRKGIFWLALFSLGYFGFYRQGCVCPIGSIQNVSEAMFHPASIASLVVLFFFFLPLLYSALFGRSYCAAVCPHGAIQDVLLVKPIEVPDWLEHCLGILPFIYIGLGVLFSATGAAYIICDYDPFVALFRLDGNSNMLGLGALFLITSMFIGRPYCRYMCPYGVLLRLFSHVSKWNVKIYPDRCINCSLCDHSCPFGAINKTTAHDSSHAKKGKKKLIASIIALPILIGVIGFGCSLLAKPFSKSHRYVQLAYDVEKYEMLVQQGVPENEILEMEWSESFRTMPAHIGEMPAWVTEIEGKTWEERRDNLMAHAQVIQNRFYWGSWALGIWIGLVIGVKLIKLSSKKTILEYEADRGSCYSCGRCYEYCPGSNGVPIQFETGGHLRDERV